MVDWAQIHDVQCQIEFKPSPQDAGTHSVPQDGGALPEGLCMWLPVDLACRDEVPPIGDLVCRKKLG